MRAGGLPRRGEPRSPISERADPGVNRDDDPDVIGRPPARDARGRVPWSSPRSLRRSRPRFASRPWRGERSSEWVRLSGRVVPPPDLDATLRPARRRRSDRGRPCAWASACSRGQVLARVGTSVPRRRARLGRCRGAERRGRRGGQAPRGDTRTRTLAERGVVSGEQAETDEAPGDRRGGGAVRRRRRRAPRRPADAVGPSSRRRSTARRAARLAAPRASPWTERRQPRSSEIAAEHPVEVALDATAAVTDPLERGPGRRDRRRRAGRRRRSRRASPASPARSMRRRNRPGPARPVDGRRRAPSGPCRRGPHRGRPPRRRARSFRRRRCAAGRMASSRPSS